MAKKHAGQFGPGGPCGAVGGWPVLGGIVCSTQAGVSKAGGIASGIGLSGLGQAALAPIVAPLKEIGAAAGAAQQVGSAAGSVGNFFSGAGAAVDYAAKHPWVILLGVVALFVLISASKGLVTAK